MGVPLIGELLTGDSKEIRDLANNEAALVGFLTLAKHIDDLPDVSTRFYEELRSLYQVTASGSSIDELMEILSEFFGTPAKAPGKNLSVTLRFDPTVKYLGGIRKDQVLFLKKLKTGAFYGALWPWKRDADKIEVLLGFCSSGMSRADFNQLTILVQQFLSKKKIETVSDVGGQLHGISLPSFLQMSEMEGATYTLKVTSGNRIGHLYLNGGSLIAAQVEGYTGNAAAYRIISWDNASIQIESADPDRAIDIHDSLMHVMMESLKIKDEAGDEPPPPVPISRVPEPPPQPKNVPSADRPTTQKNTQPEKKPAKSASKPVPKMPSEKAVAEPLPFKPPINIPFKKATDNSVGKQDQMSRTGKLLIVLIVVIIFAIVVTGGGILLEKRAVNHRYDRLIAELAITKAPDAQMVLVMKYIKAHPEDSHRSELEARLNHTYTEIEKQDYERTVSDANRLPIDEKFEQRALSLYTAFLTKYPQGAYTAQINEAIGGIRQTLGSAYFEDLKKIAVTDFPARHAAYRAYLTQFPQGTERGAVERMIADLAQENYDVVEKQIATCDAREKWDDCLAQCDRFLALFSNEAPVEKVRMLRTMLQDKQDVGELNIEAALVADDLAKTKKVYTDYLEKRPETTQKETISKRIDALRADLAGQAAWEKTAAFATHPANDIFSRIQRLDRYVENHEAGPYATFAENMRRQLDPELQDAIRAQGAELARRRALARKQAEQAEQAMAARRILRLQKQAARHLQPVASRFVDHQDGTVTDRVTGLTWCLLDSYLDLGKCISYPMAKDYVHGLNTGGRSDWRLPTAGELATIYKNSPFFPDIGADWYWTSESFVRGFHRVVDVVTSVPETEFMRRSKNEETCGAVRAVRR